MKPLLKENRGFIIKNCLSILINIYWLLFFLKLTFIIILKRVVFLKKDNIYLIVLLFLIIILALSLSFLAFEKEESKTVKTDAIKFKEEYELLNDKVDEEGNIIYQNVNLNAENLFVYSSEDEIISLLENGTGVIYFGYANCYNCRSIVPLLNKAGEELSIEKIYYLDIYNIRDKLELDENDKIVTQTEGSNGYYKILKLLDKYLPDYTLTNKSGKEISSNEKRLLAPTIIGVKNGQIVGYYESKKFSNEALTTSEQEEIEIELKNIIEKVIS